VICLTLPCTIGGRGGRQSRPKGSLYVIPTIGRCSETTLPLELDGITPMPNEVELRVKRSGEDRDVVAGRLTLGASVYTWSGLLVPLGKYTAQLYSVGDKTGLLGEFTFNNIDILKDFITRERGEIITITRGEGGEGKSENPESSAGRGIWTLENLPKSDGRNQLHIIVMNSRGNKADEYYGTPPQDQHWRSKPLLAGQYRLIVVEYKDDGSCQIIKGG
jgi:hypothetical protein